MLTERKKIMEETRKRISRALLRMEEATKLEPWLKDAVFMLLRTRLEGRTIRSSFMVLLYNYINQLAEKENVPLNRYPSSLFETELPLLAESLITIQYLQNQILDGKHGTRGSEPDAKVKRDENLLASHCLKDILFDYIDHSVLPGQADASLPIARTCRRILQYVDWGQFMQDRWGGYDYFNCGNGPEALPSREIADFIDEEIIHVFWNRIGGLAWEQPQADFTVNYLRRIYLTSGALFRLFAELELDLLGYRGAQRENILKLAAGIGMLSQLVNDICDFVPLGTAAKHDEDVYSDVRNNIVTLPLAIYFNKSNSDIKRLQNSVDSLHGHHLIDVAPGLSKALSQSILIAQQIRLDLLRYFDLSLHKGVLLEDINTIVQPSASRLLNWLTDQIGSPQGLQHERKIRRHTIAV